MSLEKFQKLIYKFANKWNGLLADDLFEFDDLVQEGWLTLWKASIKFDETRGNQFITYGYRALDNRYKTLFSHGYKKDMSVEHVDMHDENWEDGEEIEIEDKNSNFIQGIEIRDILDRLSDKARQVVEYILEDDGVDKINNIKQVIRYWRKIEKEFGNIIDVKQEIQTLLLGA